MRQINRKIDRRKYYDVNLYCIKNVNNKNTCMYFGINIKRFNNVKIRSVVTLSLAVYL